MSNDAAYASSLLQNLRTKAYGSPEQAWGAVAAIAEVAGVNRAKFAAIVCRRNYGHRPCARVGLKTKPFHVCATKKASLAQVGRIIGGHKRIALRGF
jgi:hypothetical protein